MPVVRSSGLHAGKPRLGEVLQKVRLEQVALEPLFEFILALDGLYLIADFADRLDSVKGKACLLFVFGRVYQARVVVFRDRKIINVNIIVAGRRAMLGV